MHATRSREQAVDLVSHSGGREILEQQQISPPAEARQPGREPERQVQEPGRRRVDEALDSLARFRRRGIGIHDAEVVPRRSYRELGCELAIEEDLAFVEPQKLGLGAMGFGSRSAAW